MALMMTMMMIEVAGQKDSHWDNHYHDCKYTKYYDGDDDDGGKDSNWGNNYHDTMYPKCNDGNGDDGGNDDNDLTRSILLVMATRALTKLQTTACIMEKDPDEDTQQ